MVDGMHFYRRYPDAALNGMRELTLEQRGAYNTILDLIYSRAGDVPDDDRWMAGCLGCDLRVWRRVRRELVEGGKIFIQDGLIRNSKADLEMGHVLARSEKARKAANARHQKPLRGVLTPNLRRTSAGSSPDVNDSKPTKSQSKTKKNNNLQDADALDDAMPNRGYKLEDRLSPSNDPASDFEIWWGKYPRKVGKKAAQKAFLSALSRTDLDTLVEGVRRYRSERLGKEERYTKHPATWLNGDCWNDGLPEPAAPQPDADDDPLAMTEADLELFRIFGGVATYTKLYRVEGLWREQEYGPKPDAPGNTIPPPVLAFHGYADRAIYDRWKAGAP